MIKTVSNIGKYTLGSGAVRELKKIIKSCRKTPQDFVVYFVDEYFKDNQSLGKKFALKEADIVIFVSTKSEPTTEYVDAIVKDLKCDTLSIPCAIIGVGGGSTLDVAKAVANLLTNPGLAENYQGWDLVKKPAVFKIAVPTLSGTGAEASRTCVLTNKKTGAKLGMNSDYTLYDHIIMDPDLTVTVTKDQYFYSGMDTYIHCFESLEGNFRNPIGDAFSREAHSICSDVFSSENIMSEENRLQLMVASYLGGCAIATSYVGLVHPLSAGLSVVLGYHHCIANCIVMRAMSEFYPLAFDQFWDMANKNRISIPIGVTQNCSDKEYDALYQATIIHERPLQNALGSDFRKILTKEKVKQLFKEM